MTIDISKGVYLTTKEIIDYAEKHNLTRVDVWRQVIQKFVDLGANEYEGRADAVSDYSGCWRGFNLVGVEEAGDTYHCDVSIHFGKGVTQITLDQLFSNEEVTKVTAEATKEDNPFQLEVGKIYKSGSEHHVKIVHKVAGLTATPFVGVRCTVEGYPIAYVGLYSPVGHPDVDSAKACKHYLKPIPKEHPNVAKIKELEEQINKLKEEMK